MTKIYFNLRSHCATEIEHLRPYPVNLANVYYVLIWNMYSLFGTTIFFISLILSCFIYVPGKSGSSV